MDSNTEDTAEITVGPEAEPGFDYIDTNDGLEAFVRGLGDEPGIPCAVDTEADSLHCYEEKLCLIQLAVGMRVVIVDPLAIEELGPLVEFFDRASVWMHGADFDMRMLRRTFGRIPDRVYDTQVAARLLGHRKFGLANLVEAHFGVTLPKGSQKADWGRRPLSDKMLDYAANDVRYLLSMAESLSDRLRERGRWDWFIESCDAARESATHRREKNPDEIWRISGWGKLERRGMAYLRALWFWRDGEAKRRDRPSFKIIGNEQLMRFSQELDTGKTIRLPDRFPPPPVRRFHAAVKEAAALAPDEWPTGPKRVRGKRDPDSEGRFDRLRKHRDEVAGELGLDGTLIASRNTLEVIAARGDEGIERLLSWQKNLLEPALSKLSE